MSPKSNVSRNDIKGRTRTKYLGVVSRVHCLCSIVNAPPLSTTDSIAATPTNLLCFTPPAIDRGLSHSPGARSPSVTLFDWFESFSEFRNRSVAGSPTTPVDHLSYYLRSLVQLDDSYEMQCRCSRMAQQMIESNDCGGGKGCRTEHMLAKIPNLTDGNQNMVHGLIWAAVEYSCQGQHICQGPHICPAALITTFKCAMHICKHLYPCRNA